MVENKVDQKLTSIRGHYCGGVYSRFVEDKGSEPFDVYSAQLVRLKISKQSHTPHRQKSVPEMVPLSGPPVSLAPEGR